MASGEAFLDEFYVPALGSVASRGGDPSICRGAAVSGADLVFQSRSDPKACALGAFERAPVRKFTTRTDIPAVHADAHDDFGDDDGYQASPVTQGGTGVQPSPTSPTFPLTGSTSSTPTGTTSSPAGSLSSPNTGRIP
jgi:hypothetical protein